MEQKLITFTNSYSNCDEITTNKIIKGWGKIKKKEQTEIPAGKSLSGSNTENKICTVHHCITDKQSQWFKFPVTCQHGSFLSMIANRATDRQAPSCHPYHPAYMLACSRGFTMKSTFSHHTCVFWLSSSGWWHDGIWWDPIQAGLNKMFFWIHFRLCEWVDWWLKLKGQVGRESDLSVSCSFAKRIILKLATNINSMTASLSTS